MGDFQSQKRLKYEQRSAEGWRCYTSMIGFSLSATTTYLAGRKDHHQ